MDCGEATMIVLLMIVVVLIGREGGRYGDVNFKDNCDHDIGDESLMYLG